MKEEFQQVQISNTSMRLITTALNHYRVYLCRQIRHSYQDTTKKYYEERLSALGTAEKELKQ